APGPEPSPAAFPVPPRRVGRPGAAPAGVAPAGAVTARSGRAGGWAGRRDPQRGAGHGSVTPGPRTSRPRGNGPRPPSHPAHPAIRRWARLVAGGSPVGVVLVTAQFPPSASASSISLSSLASPAARSGTRPASQDWMKVLNVVMYAPPFGLAGDAWVSGFLK